MFAHAQIALNGLWLGFLAMHYLVAPLGVWPAYGLGTLGVHRLERRAVGGAQAGSLRANCSYDFVFASFALSA